MRDFYTYNIFDEKHYSINLAYATSRVKEYCSKPGRLRLIFCETPKGTIQVHNIVQALASSFCFCANRDEDIRLSFERTATIHEIYFEPSTIHTALTYENITDLTKVKDKSAQFDLFLLQKFAMRLERLSGLLFLDLSQSHYVETTIKHIADELLLQPSAMWPCKSRAYLMELLHFISGFQAEKSEITQLSKTNSDADKLLIYLNTHFNKKISLDELALTFESNRTTLTEKCKARTGMTIHQYLVKKRIEVASTLLRDTNLPIYDIIHRIGYEDKTHFSLAFKKETGLSLSEYRVKYQLKKMY